MKDLVKSREAIDGLDEKILKLLAERREVASEIAEYKLEHNQGVMDYAREQSKLQELARKARVRGLPASFICTVYEIIMKHTVAYEQRYITEKLNHGDLKRDTSVAFLGPVGTYSHLASRVWLEHYRGEITEYDCSSFAEILGAVEKRTCEYGLLPIENSNSGSINEVLDVLQLSRANFVGEVFLPIDHAVMSAVPSSIEQITDLYSHPQPVQQCSVWLKEFLPKVTIHYTKSSADAMRKVRELKDPASAAIASHRAAPYYQLTPLMDNIANNPHNYTRFIAISMLPVSVPEQIEAKTSISFTVAKYTPGSLIAVLNEFSAHGINLTKLSSRPLLAVGRDTWEEIFFADIQANIASPVMQEILHKIKSYTGTLKILGCYASADRR